MIETDIIVNLDYRKTRSVEQLICWGEKAFNLPAEPGESIEAFTYRLYHHIGKGSVAYTVVEHNIGACTSALKNIIAASNTGWKTAFVSGIAHDYGLHLTFSEAAKNDRKWWCPW